MAIDVSRSAFDPRKRYDGVRMQMGRVLTDDDFNSAGEILDEDRRRTAVDVIGPTGTPDGGFAVRDPRASGAAIDFDIGAGSLYLGGERLETDGSETFQLQDDWLEQSAADRPAPPAGDERFDLVWLEAVLQDVTGVEDTELLEVALGVADTSARTRVVRRVRVTEDVGSADCADGWDAVVAGLAGEGTVDAGHEVVGDAVLTVTYAAGGDPEDLCSPTAAGGYLGADNQALRVQLVDDGQALTFGADDSTPLYRVQVGTDATGARRVITMLTEPYDQPHWPLAGQVIELLPWAVVLPNGEKVAARSGLLARVDGSYDPVTGELTIATAVPAGFGEEWKARADAADLRDEFLYMRVWNRGDDTASALAIPCPDGTPVPLGSTGLNVVVDGAQRAPGDHWIIAARPHTPTQVVPWELEAGMAPQGFRRWVTPLGVIRWDGAGAGTVVDDCREWFPPLTGLRSCCTVTVGRGGRFASIQEAVDFLPDAGGQVCVLPGFYDERVEIRGRRQITISGCGIRSVIRAPGPGGGDPVILVRNSDGITIRDLGVMADEEGPGIRVAGGGAKWLPFRRREPTVIRLTGLTVTAATRSAIEVLAGVDVQVRDCLLAMEDVLSPFPALFFTAEDGLIEGCRMLIIGSAPVNGRVTGVSAGRGGLQLAGTCERVRVRDNLIQGGIGNGITLGSVHLVVEQGDESDEVLGWVIGTEDPCDPGDVVIEEPGDGDGGIEIVSDGPLREIEIEGNRILDMGLNGIGVIGFWLPGAGEMVSVEGLTICRNQIRRCLARDLAEIPATLLNALGFGGIALAGASDLVVRENVIEDNGRGEFPVCGMFLLHGEGVEITGNRIRDNGVHAGKTFLPGRRGGIDVVVCTPAPRVSGGFAEKGASSPEPALRVAGNAVSQPVGPALSAGVLGPVHVHGNDLASEGLPEGRELSFLGATVTILQLGSSLGFGGYAGGFTQMATGQASMPAVDAPPPSSATVGAVATPPALGLALALIPRGNLLFNDNQCLLLAGDETSEDSLLALTSVLLLSLDDAGVEGNQFDVRLTNERVSANVLAAGLSLRVSDNRFKEGLGQVFLSGMTVGLMNVTTHNEANHCLIVRGPPALTIDEPNLVLLDALVPELCARFGALLQGAKGGGFA